MAQTPMDFDSEEDLEKMESDLNHIAHKVSVYRNNLPDNMGNTLDSVISSHTFDFHNSDHWPFRTNIAGCFCEDPVEPVLSKSRAHQGGKEHESRDGLTQLKEHCHNASSCKKSALA